MAVIAIVALALILGTGGGGYSVHATFVNASQIVKGNDVRVSGTKVGSVDDIKLTDDGQAQLTLSIDADGYHPLREGSRAIVREASLSGEANRYIDLQLGPATGRKIPAGGTLQTTSTVAAVDLDQLFNTFDERTRKGVRKTIGFLRDFQAGNEQSANDAVRYLNPALSSSARLFGELNRNTPDFERFIVETSKLVTDVSSRDDALSELVRNLATTTSALTAGGDGLAQAVGLLPGFLRKSDTTFVNLRSTLDDLQPLVDDAKPIVRDKLIPLLRQLRPFAREARPTIRDLSRSVRRPGADNDLVELLRRQPALDQIATQSARRNGKDRPGALPALRSALRGATPQLGFLRPYAPDLIGWFDDFSTSGAYDAMGNFSRVGLELNGFTLGPLLNLLPIPPDLRNQLLSAGVQIKHNNRCPGSVERPAPDGSNPFKPSQEFNCDPTQKAVGK